MTPTYLGLRFASSSYGTEKTAASSPGLATSQFEHLKSGIKSWVRLIIAPGNHEKMSSARSADRRKRPRSGFGTALVPLSRPPLIPGNTLFQGNDLTFEDFVGRKPAGETPPSTFFLARISFRSTEIAARIIGVAVAPFQHQCLKLAIVPVGEDDFGGDEQVPGRPAFGRPLPLRRKVRPLEVFSGSTVRPRRRASARGPCRRERLHRA